MKKLITLLFVLVSIVGMSQDFKPTDLVPDLSKETSTYIEQLVIEKINKGREDMGREPLTFDTLLAPAGDHHALYMRKLGKLTHWEEEDVEGMEEYDTHLHRIDLLDRDKIEDLSESIGSGLLRLKDGWDPHSFDEISTHLVYCFNQSKGHWDDITNVKWDCVYVVYDLLNDNDDEKQYSSGTYITVMLGQYTDEYKKELGVK